MIRITRKHFPWLLCAIVILSLSLFSCNSDYSVGKKKGYFRISFPEKKYQLFNQPGYPYTFEYPVYANVIRDTTFFEDKAGDWWINIDIPRFEGRIHVSYKPINAENSFDSLVSDGFKMAFKQHVDVSTGINDSLMQTPNGVEGIYFSLGGNTATANRDDDMPGIKHRAHGFLLYDIDRPG